MENRETDIMKKELYESVRELLLGARRAVHRAVNFTMVQTYWAIGRLIVEDEQQGAHRASYGKATLQELSRQLTEEFEKGFDASNLRYMRLFYLAFPICDALRPELSWTHYCCIIKVGSEKARNCRKN